MYKEVLLKIISENNGILKTSDAVAAGISKDLFYKFINDRKMKKAAHGIYICPESQKDEFKLLQEQFPKAVFSHNTALYLHGLAESKLPPITVTVDSSYNSTGIKKLGAKVHFTKSELYSTGIVEGISPYGNKIKLYNIERTICDIIRYSDDMDAAVIDYAVNAYANRPDKDLLRLSKYAEKLHLNRRIRNIKSILL